MTEQVVGDWKDFEFKMATPVDYPKILDHVRNVFCKTETLLGLVGYSEGLGDDVCKYVEHVLEQEDGLSFYALHKESEKLAGVRVTYKARKEDADAELPVNLAPRSLAGKNIFKNVFEISKSAKIFERYGVDFYGELFLTAVTPEYRRQGLVTEMYSRSIKFLRAKGYPVAKSIFTSPYTRRVAAKFGFEEVNRKYLRDFLDIDGKKFLLNAEDEFGATMAIEFL